VIELRQTDAFSAWFRALRDAVAQRRIARRLALLEGGHFGDVKNVGGKVSELRIDHGPAIGFISRAAAKR
jgi:putative addiction module killer protein